MVTEYGMSPIIPAFDYDNTKQAYAMGIALGGAGCAVKVGKELFTRAGPVVVENLLGMGHQVFLDLKYHDIPNTVAGACRTAAELGVWMLNVHTQGGERMMEAAANAVANYSDRPLVVGVTVLTSLDENDLVAQRINDTVTDHVSLLAAMAEECGLDGVVCSPREVEQLRAERSAEFRLVTPGIRSADSAPDDQRRKASVEEAIGWGSDYLVVGRPITAAANPMASFRKHDGRARAHLLDVGHG